MDVKLNYCGNALEILNFRHNREEEFAGNPYNCCFNIRVVSGVFSGFSDVCEYDYKEWKMFIKLLNDVYLFKAGKAELSEIGYGSKICFTGDKLGHITVSGEIFGNAMSHSLKFTFITDQSAFPGFLAELDNL